MIINVMGRHKQAETLHRQAQHTFENVLGLSHPDTHKTYTNFATALHDQRKYKQAEAAVAFALPVIESTYGSAHAEFMEALEFHAILLHCLELYTAALAVAAKAYENRLISCGYNHDEIQRVLSHFRDLAENCEEEQTMVLFPTFVAAIAA